jgi:prephenate dehydrogenase
MSPEDHDRHIAYVSHISHISSFTLGLTVLEIEKDEERIFDMASTGFASTVRLAKSSPDMWAPIFKQNAPQLSTALDAYIKNLQLFKELIEEGNIDEIRKLMTQANDIRRILDGIRQ